MKEIKWYFPDNLKEVSALLKKDGVIPHGGGTGILKASMSSVKGLIDLALLPLGFFRVNNRTIEIGAAQTYAEVVENMRKIDPEHILVKALSVSASTPLRNRITVGGSIALFPPWSDLMGPLIALDAEVSLCGSREGDFNITSYVNDRHLARGNLITGIKINRDRWTGYYYRETRTHFDYPAFTVTILLKKAGKVIEDTRIVIVGCTGRFRRLLELEEYIKGRDAGRVEPKGISEKIKIDFTGKKSLSPVYIKHLAKVRIERGLATVLGN